MHFTGAQTQNMFSSHRGFLTNAMHHHRYYFNPNQICSFAYFIIITGSTLLNVGKKIALFLSIQ